MSHGTNDESARVFADRERPPVFPVCLLVDVSWSMTGSPQDAVRPIDAVNKVLPELQQVILDNPGTGEIARVALVTFSDTAECVLPLSDLKYATLPVLQPQSGTNFAPGLRTARQALVDGITGLGRGTRFHRPVVFFISDGEHIAAEDWAPAFRQLASREDKFGAEVVSFGFGQANRDVITQVSTRHAFFAAEQDPAKAVEDILHTVIRSIQTTSSSFSAGAAAGLSVPHSGTSLIQLPVNTV